MIKVENKLRVCHIPQVGNFGEASGESHFYVEVKDEEQAALIINTLAQQHLWLLKNNFIPDYSNVICVEMYDEDIDEETGEAFGWTDYWNDSECMEWDEFEETYFPNYSISVSEFNK
jgi:hypothetical protein